MKYCNRCVYPANHPLTISFDDQGVCSGCRIHEEKDSLNWVGRADKLKDLLNSFKNRSGRNFDCVVPVSGAGDTYFIVHTLKNVYKLNPLLVCYNKQYNTKVGIRNLAYLRSVFDCDYLIKTVSPDTVKKISKITLKKMGSMYWHCLAGSTVFPVQIAVQFKIPLIIWGAHQGCDQVGMFSHLDEVEMTRKYRKEHDLMGYEAEDLVEGEALDQNDVESFVYPHDGAIESVGVRGVYLSNYIRWDSKKQHELMIKLYGYESAAQQRTFDTYNNVDCFHYSGIHDYIKFLKYGYGKAADHASREIRLKRLTREEGVELVKKHQNVEPNDLNIFLEWIGMTEKEFYACINNVRDKSIWRLASEDRWELKDSVINHVNSPDIDASRLKKIEECSFKLTPSRKPEEVEDSYVLIGKGFVN